MNKAKKPGLEAEREKLLKQARRRGNGVDPALLARLLEEARARRKPLVEEKYHYEYR